MKKRIIFIVIVILFIFTNCDDNFQNRDCICTEEFRMYTLTILDSANSPIDSVNILVKDKLNNSVYDLSDYYSYTFFPGTYVIFHDGFIEHMTYYPKIVLVEIEIDSITKVAEYTFKTDECKCVTQFPISRTLN